jgi:hypothetical protein
MIKPNQTSSANVNVLAESDLTKVVGGCGYRRNNYRWRRHHGWGWRHRDYGHEGGFQSQGPDNSFDSDGSDFEDPSTTSGSDDTTDASTPV